MESRKGFGRHFRDPQDKNYNFRNREDLQTRLNIKSYARVFWNLFLRTEILEISVRSSVSISDNGRFIVILFNYTLFIAWIIPKTRDVSASRSVPVSTNYIATLSHSHSKTPRNLGISTQVSYLRKIEMVISVTRNVALICTTHKIDGVHLNGHTKGLFCSRFQ